MATDAAPNRFSRAKFAALDLMRLARSDRLALIAFGGVWCVVYVVWCVVSGVCQVGVSGVGISCQQVWHHVCVVCAFLALLALAERHKCEELRLGSLEHHEYIIRYSCSTTHHTQVDPHKVGLQHHTPPTHIRTSIRSRQACSSATGQSSPLSMSCDAS